MSRVRISSTAPLLLSVRQGNAAEPGRRLQAGVAQWQSSSLPSWLRGFDSHHPLQKNGRQYAVPFSYHHTFYRNLYRLPACAPASKKPKEGLGLLLTPGRNHGIILHVLKIKPLGVAQFGSVLEWGSRGRRFKSFHPDHENPWKRKVSGDFFVRLT